jgi:hypothetical protein
MSTDTELEGILKEFLALFNKPDQSIYFFILMRDELVSKHAGSVTFPRVIEKVPVWDVVKDQPCSKFRKPALSTTISSSRFSRQISKLHALNEAGYDIYFTMNPLGHRRRLQALVPYVQGFVLEADDGNSLEEQEVALKCFKHHLCAAVFTGNRSIHLYVKFWQWLKNPHYVSDWRIARLLTDGRRSIPEYAQVTTKCRKVLEAHGYHPDPRVLSDYAHLLRLPTFIHHKTGKRAEVLWTGKPEHFVDTNNGPFWWGEPITRSSNRCGAGADPDPVQTCSDSSSYLTTVSPDGPCDAPKTQIVSVSSPEATKDPAGIDGVTCGHTMRSGRDSSSDGVSGSVLMPDSGSGHSDSMSSLKTSLSDAPCEAPSGQIVSYLPPEGPRDPFAIDDVTEGHTMRCESHSASNALSSPLFSMDEGSELTRVYGGSPGSGSLSVSGEEERRRIQDQSMLHHFEVTEAPRRPKRTFLDDLDEYERLTREGIPGRHQRNDIHEVMFTVMRVRRWSVGQLKTAWKDILSIHPENIGCGIEYGVEDIVRHWEDLKNKPDWIWHPDPYTLPDLSQERIRAMKGRLQERGCREPNAAAKIIARVLYPACQRCPAACREGRAALQSKDIQRACNGRGSVPAMEWLREETFLARVHASYIPGHRSMLYFVNQPLVLHYLGFRTEELGWLPARAYGRLAMTA